MTQDCSSKPGLSLPRERHIGADEGGDHGEGATPVRTQDATSSRGASGRREVLRGAFPSSPVDCLAEQVGVPGVAGVLLDHVDQ